MPSLMIEPSLFIIFMYANENDFSALSRAKERERVCEGERGGRECVRESV